MRAFQLLTGSAAVIALLADRADPQQPPAQPAAVIVGRVTDTLGAPLPYCFVRLESAPSAVLCDSAGRFRLAGVSRELTTFEVRRLGYVPGRFTAMVLSDSMEFALQLVPVATVLRPIGVTAPAAPPYDPWLLERGFYERMRAGVTGMFITPEELARLKPQRVTHILEDRPGLRITYSGGGAGQYRTPLLWGRGYCLLNVFVDGIELQGIYASDEMVRRGGVEFVGSPGWRNLPGLAARALSPITGVGIDAFLQPSEIAAMEVYPSGPTTPIEFRSANGCGAIVIWTKVGTRPSSTDSARAQPTPPDSGGAR
jgi:hypothetical protein